MNSQIRSIISHGPEGIPVDIECHLSNNLPNIVIVGFANKTVDESRERIRGAFTNTGLQLPRKRISVNLAPADLPKDSSSLDLPIALTIMLAARRLAGHDVRTPRSDEAFIGELGLDGSIRPVRGIIGKLLGGRRHGLRRFYIPAANIAQASVVPHIELVQLDGLRQLYGYMTGAQVPDVVRTGSGRRIGLTGSQDADQAGITLDDVIGQVQAKRALQIAAAGGHNVLLNGPPGTGKSMLARALANLLPPLSHEEILEVTHLHSLAGHEYDRLITERPFRSPHHSASHVSIVGGGTMVRPGEVSLAHRGVLFFDELPEFDRPTIEALRQPLEDRTITVSRARESSLFPANFIFVATANPCPCGFHGTQPARRRSRSCECPAHIIQAYRRKMSGPLIDRMDICVNVEHVDHKRLLRPSAPAPTEVNSDSYASIKRLVLEARKRQTERFGSLQRLNSDMSNADLKLHANLTPAARRTLNRSAANIDMSVRSYMRCAKVARTIADLAGSDTIEKEHILEAITYHSQQVLPA